MAFEGLIRNVERRYRETASEAMQGRNMRQFMRITPCKTCGGQRLKTELPGSYRRWEKYLRK